MAWRGPESAGRTARLTLKAALCHLANTCIDLRTPSLEVPTVPHPV
jgi:hypothetical protein